MPTFQTYCVTDVAVVPRDETRRVESLMLPIMTMMMKDNNDNLSDIQPASQALCDDNDNDYEDVFFSDRCAFFRSRVKRCSSLVLQVGGDIVAMFFVCFNIFVLVVSCT